MTADVTPESSALLVSIGDDQTVLRVLGLSPVEQGLYEALISRPPVTGAELAEIATTNDWSDHSGPALDRLMALELVTRLPTDPPRYAAAPPDTALRSLMSAQAEELAAARERMAALTTRFQRNIRGTESNARVEVLRGRAAIARRLAEITESARHKVQAFDRPPYVGDPRQGNVIAPGMADRGVSFAVIYHQDAMNIPGRMRAIVVGEDHHERTRVGDSPIKMVLVDDRVAIVSVHRDTPPADAMMMVNDPTLVRLLSLLFELCWEYAVPLQFRATPAPSTPSDQQDQQEPPEPPLVRTDFDRGLFALLVAGLTDRDIAEGLNWTDRTVRRRVHEMMIHLGARTRFQAGYEAVLRGWVPSTGGSTDGSTGAAG